MTTAWWQGTRGEMGEGGGEETGRGGGGENGEERGRGGGGGGGRGRGEPRLFVRPSVWSVAGGEAGRAEGVDSSSSLPP